MLLRPTKELVEEYARRFELNNSEPENAIRLLCEKFPDNESFESVLLKSIVINTLYSTQIRSIKPIAEHILALDIDAELLRGDPELVDKIARVSVNGKQRVNYSFATKYCSFHNPDAYPIYDRFVALLLTEYQRQGGFYHFKKAELRDYASFRRVLDAFRNYYDLTGVSAKALDNFLWGYGNALFKKPLK